ncbi:MULTISPECIES: DUF4381 domain-containing protein [unclassified Photobacterium]|uniref:DUF4381 domain-containing protein n=1 Tax=unclassified Photobacterium TaxID=2628852 RepID=UPI000D167DAB|nr:MULTISPECIES: DUF4381 domain-containing protein [unclassified Photobacterium]PSV26156.1 DUF4381 domain-containing protein [Photobacterium sp. GB-56]PSV30807.1 DUF4381 domain-containing protein [Photobacterium sp. GB-72]PSV37660.1 DUF4381 domain-containing protein [Photobacterium sp. GB-210]PSV38303.1 DUF4381 domain-containing protein [Photobacterium sp. GB-27]PSV44998.1 DUF4381 domain-containing protein [Photobacterium sp. GB-36]
MATPSVQQLPLADIHLPQAPNFWPLAWGWWVLFAVVILAIAVVVTFIRRKKHADAAQKEALQKLSLITAEQGLPALNTLLKQAALSYYSRTIVAPLTGEAWLAFLDNQLPVKYSGFSELKSVWLSGSFSNTPLSHDDFQQCKTMANTWLKHALPPRKLPSMTQKESSNV